MPVRILAADNSATMRKILEMTFAGEPAEVVTVANGESAIRAAADGGFDVVIADVSMPGTDGYAVANAIRKNPATAGTAVILLASQHNPFDPDRGRANGVDDHVLKPFDSQSLIDKVAETLRRPRAELREGSVARPVPAGARDEPRSGTRAAAPAPMPARASVAQAPPAQAAPASSLRLPQPPKPEAKPKPVTPSAPPAASAAAAVASHAFATQASRASAPGALHKPPSRSDSASESPTRAYSDPLGLAGGANGGALAHKLAGLGLTAEQIDGVLQLSREVVEQVVWEVVPDLAESLIREEIKRLTE